MAENNSSCLTCEGSNLSIGVNDNLSNASKLGNLSAHVQFRICTFFGVTVIQYNYFHVMAELLITLNVLACIPTIFLNILAIVTIRRMNQLFSSSFVLLCGLALTDLLVGLVVQPMFIGYLISAIYGKWKVNCALHVLIYVIGTILTGVSLLSITTISVERYLALRLQNRFRIIVTPRRVIGCLVVIWMSLVTVSLMYFWNRNLVQTSTGFIIVITTIIIFLSYLRIFQLLKEYKKKIHSSESKQHPPLHLAKYRKTVITSLYIVITLFICYLPWLSSVVATVILGYTRPLYGAFHVASTFVYLNSLLNPVLYCWRIRDIRQAFQSVVRQTFCARQK